MIPRAILGMPVEPAGSCPWHEYQRAQAERRERFRGLYCRYLYGFYAPKRRAPLLNFTGLAG